MTQLNIPSPTKPERIRIAFATDDVQQVNRCFATANTFAVFSIGPRRAELTAAIEFSQRSSSGNAHLLGMKVQRFDGCTAIFCSDFKSAESIALAKAGIQPRKVAHGIGITDLIGSIQESWPLPS